MERLFLLTPLREGRPTTDVTPRCSGLFLLTPLREGRPDVKKLWEAYAKISTHAPAGGATESKKSYGQRKRFLLTPLREGRHISA